MSITGDIDLTEGLDFYRHKKLPKIIPKDLPWIIERNKEKKSIQLNLLNDNIISYICDDTISTYISSSQYTYRYTSSSNSRTSYSYNYDNFSLYNYNTLSSTYTYDMIDYKNELKKYSLKELSKPSFHLGDIRNTLKHFYIKRCKYCNKPIICNNYIHKECIEKYEVSKKYPWESINHFKFINYSNYIPWDNVKEENKTQLIDRRINKLRKIPWLKNLHSRLFNYYTNELKNNGEIDNDSFLTDMGWIGINEHSGRPQYTIDNRYIDSPETINSIAI